MTTRRAFIRTVAEGLLVTAGGIVMPRFAGSAESPAGPPELPAGARQSAALEALAGKKPLIRKSFRPPNFETPLAYFNEPFTPNDAFFVRYHLANIPRIDIREWKLRIGGESVQRPLEFTLAELKTHFEQIEFAAVNQCSGNRRGLVQPHVPGVQWGYGAMGNALWKGVRLKEVLDRAGISKDAVEVVFDGADSGVAVGTPDFLKSLPLSKALDENTLIAFEMNGQALPHWNGYPVRLVVPGWTATYWIKHLTSISVIAKPFEGFWMSTAYRIPKGAFPTADRFASQETDANVPITEMVVNSLITNLEEGQGFRLGQWIEAKGIAWDGGYGIERVELSTDEGKSWHPAGLGKDYGRFAWRPWTFRFKADRQGSQTLMARATNRIGSSQPFRLTENPAGYHHNRVQKLNLVVA